MFKNPNFIDQAADRYTKYQSQIVEFLAQLAPDQAGFDFNDIRAYFAQHPDQAIRDLVPEMTDGVLDDLCQRHGIERA